MRYFKIFVAIGLLLFPFCASGKQMFSAQTSGPVDIVADSVENDREKNTFTARGNVELKEGTRLLKADSVFYDDTTKDVIASGHVFFQDGGDSIECNTMRLNLETKKGTLDKGRIFLKEGNFFVSGGPIEKVGESQYVMDHGEFTTCGFDKPDWKFTAEDIDITLEGYAKTKHAKFHILNFPIFYFPYAIFPAKTERQSGFLIPEIALSSRNGTIFKNAYFWAISKDKDATFYTTYIGDRGIQLGAEFRYALEEETRGKVAYFYLYDREYHGSRWQLQGQHSQKLSDNLYLKADVNFVSDKMYLFDMGETYLERTENKLRSTFFLEKTFDKSQLTVETTFFKDLGYESYSYDTNKLTDPDTILAIGDFLHGTDHAYQYLPRISYFTEYIPILAGKLFTNFSADLTNFDRRDQLETCYFVGTKTYCRQTDLANDFMETPVVVEDFFDCIYSKDKAICRRKGDKYTRLALEPSVRLPFSVGGVNFLLSGTYIGTGYLARSSDTVDDGTSFRNTIRIDGDMSMQFMRNFNTSLFGMGEVLSVVRPHLRYTFIPTNSSGDLPYIDPYDRINRTNAITYSLEHYLYRAAETAQREFALFEISQTYGLSEDLKSSPLYKGYGNRLSEIDARITFYPMSNLSYTNETVLNVSGEGLTTMRNELRYKIPNKFNLSIWHSYTRDLTNEMLFSMGGFYKKLEGVYQVRYSFLDQAWLDTVYRLTYHAGCWGVTLYLNRTRSFETTTFGTTNILSSTHDTRFGISFSLAGLTNLGK